MDNKELKKLPKLVLLNSEGDILTAYKAEDKFYIIDEYKKIIGELTNEDFSLFINGLTMLITSKGEMIFYNSFVSSMKPKENVLKKFINN